MTNEEKIEKICWIIREVFKNKNFPISAWDEYYVEFIDALGEIETICYKE